MELLNHPSGPGIGPFVVIADIDAGIVFVNQAYSLRFPGIGKGKNLTDIVNAEQQHLIKDNISLCLQRASASPQVFTTDHYEGITIRWELSFMAAEGTAPARLLFTGSETQVQNKQPEAEANLRSILNNTDVTYIVLDTKLNIVSFNAIAQQRSRLFFNEELQPGKYFPASAPDHQRSAQTAILEDVLRGDTREYESEYILPDGSSRIFYIRITPVFGDEKQVRGLCFAATDITVIKSAEFKLQASYDRLNSLINNTPLAIIEYDKDMVVTKWNEQAEHIFGWKAGEAIGQRMNDKIVYEKDWGIVQEEIARLQHDNTHQTASENRNITRDGKIIHCRWYNSVLRDSSGKITAYLSLVNDITSQKTAEANLREREEQLRLFIEHSPAALAMFDTGMRYLVISHRWLTDYNLGEIDIIGKSHYEVFPDIPQHWKDVHQRALKGAIESKMEDPFVRIDGTVDWVKWEVRPWYKASGEIGGIIMFTEVITEQKEAEIRFKNLAEKSLVGVYIIQDEKYAYVNPKFAEIFGYTQEELMNNLTVEQVIFEEDRPLAMKNIRDRIDENKEIASYELRGRKKDGQQIWIEVFGNRMQHKGKTAIIGTLLDITNRKRAEEALMRSEANLHTIFETTDTAYVLFNRDLKIISYNSKASAFVSKMLKETPDLDHSIFDYLLDDKKENLKNLIPEVLNGKTISYESNYPQQDGTQHWYHIRIYPVTNPEQKVFSIMMAISDITGRKTSERTLINHMKLLEELSFVTSHELRHEYAKVQSAINFLKDIKSPQTEQSMVIGEIERSFDNINKLIYKLNDKITFNQGGASGTGSAAQFNAIEKILLVDDDPMINFLNERILNSVLKGEKEIRHVTGVDEALDYLERHDTKGDHLIFLDLNMPERSGWDFLDVYGKFRVQSPVMILTSSIDPADMEKSKLYPQVKKFLTKPLPVKFVKSIFINE